MTFNSLTPSTFVYTKAAAARILNIDVSQIAVFEVWADVCFVRILGESSKFMSKTVFRHHFADWRIQRSKSLDVTQVNQELYRVTTPHDTRVESVSVDNKSIRCGCSDYQTQITIFGRGKGCCSHAYSVLNHLGYQRLSDYVHTKGDRLTASYS